MKEYVRKEVKQLCILYDVPLPKIAFTQLDNKKGAHLTGHPTLEQILVFDIDNFNNDVENVVYHEFAHLLQFYKIDPKIMSYWQKFSKHKKDLTYIISAHEVSARVFAATHDWEQAELAMFAFDSIRLSSQTIEEKINYCVQLAKCYYRSISASLP